MQYPPTLAHIFFKGTIPYGVAAQFNACQCQNFHPLAIGDTGIEGIFQPRHGVIAQTGFNLALDKSNPTSQNFPTPKQTIIYSPNIQNHSSRNSIRTKYSVVMATLQCKSFSVLSKLHVSCIMFHVSCVLFTVPVSILSIYPSKHQAKMRKSLCLNSATFHTPFQRVLVKSPRMTMTRTKTRLTRFLQTSHPSSLQPSLSAPFSTMQLRLPSSHLSSVTLITGPKLQTPRRSS